MCAKARHRNFCKKRSRNPVARASSDRWPLAAGRTHEETYAEDKKGDCSYEEIPLAANEFAYVDKKLRRSRRFRAEILEDFAEDRDNFYN